VTTPEDETQPDSPALREASLLDRLAAGDTRAAERLVDETYAQVYAAPAGPPSELSGWDAPVGEVTEAEETQEIALRVPQPSTYFLLWFTRASEARDQAGRYQIEISDIELFG